jgi:hypothetical protein
VEFGGFFFCLYFKEDIGGNFENRLMVVVFIFWNFFVGFALLFYLVYCFGGDYYDNGVIFVIVNDGNIDWLFIFVFFCNSFLFVFVNNLNRIKVF